MTRTTRRPRRTSKRRQVHAHLRIELLFRHLLVDMLSLYVCIYTEVNLHGPFMYHTPCQPILLVYYMKCLVNP
jgi:hypothetical protein